ncbi:Serine/arginine repetitive matrix 1 [Gossypium australe]|uniref:Serine/arginine repetitive matrix 1 n=1 Tax=Gossypium australe TaxID=47621 RepID=A0A5B6WWB2_9ROSI|nr:Serine/arginine repetitive matrix 1 [Gossypium australe]
MYCQILWCRMRWKLSPVGHNHSSMRSTRTDRMDQSDTDDKVPGLSPPPNKSPLFKSPSHVRNRSGSEDRRSSSPYGSPPRQRKSRIARDDSFSPEQKPRELKGHRDGQGTGRRNETSESRHSPPISRQRVSPRKVRTPERLAGSRSTDSRSRLDNVESRKKDLETKRSSGEGVHSGTPDRQRSPAISEDSFQGEKRSRSRLREGKRSGERSRSHKNTKDSDEHHKVETSPMLLEKVDYNNRGSDSDSKGSDKRRTKHKDGKRKHKRSERRKVTSDDDDSSYDSEIDDRKEAKRRKKEEKRLRKEEKRKRSEERRRKREARRAEKLKTKRQDDDSSSDGEHVGTGKSRPGDDEEAETEQKKLEIELRKKALESLKAKKGISH